MRKKTERGKTIYQVIDKCSTPHAVQLQCTSGSFGGAEAAFEAAKRLMAMLADGTSLDEVKAFKASVASGARALDA